MALENLGETFLTVAQNQNLELVTLILEVTGPDIVHSRSIPGETALHLSIAFVSRDNTEVMEFLLASGANVNGSYTSDSDSEVIVMVMVKLDSEENSDNK